MMTSQYPQGKAVSKHTPPPPKKSPPYNPNRHPHKNNHTQTKSKHTENAVTSNGPKITNHSKNRTILPSDTP